MRVTCRIEECDLENDDGKDVPGVRATCSRCQQESESFGTEGRSIRRCLVLLRENCAYGEANFYVADSDGDEE